MPDLPSSKRLVSAHDDRGLPRQDRRVRALLLRLTIATGLLVVCFALSGCSIGASEVAVPLELEPTVLLVSFDGFRWDYMERAVTPTLDRMAAEGVQARGLIPVYPSKTFPSHYSIATGLYPGHHGILSNHIRDAALGADFHLGDREQVERGDWWGGEPIWVTAERQGRIAATLFWPGSEAAIAGVRPSHWERYNERITWQKRVATVLGWLDLPAGERPRLITLYFEEPNEAGHRYGPDSPKTTKAVERVDAILASLIRGLEARSALDQVNLILVSDHGMAAVGPERTIYIDDYLEPEQAEIFETGAVLQVFPAPGFEEAVYDALTGAHPHLDVYRADEIPERYHLRGNSRVAPIWGMPDVGWEALTRDGATRTWGAGLGGDHGQDPFHPDMHGLFIARGPAFRRGVQVDAFENIQVYNLMAHALGIQPAENDGDLAAVRGVLREGQASSPEP